MLQGKAVVLIAVVHEGLEREFVSLELDAEAVGKLGRHREGMSLAGWAKAALEIDLEAVDGPAAE